MKRVVKFGLLLVAMTTLLVGCNPVKKMQSNVGKVEVTSNPTTLENRGGKVSADVTVTFPEKYFYEDVIVKVTPVLVYADTEVAAADKYFQGEDVMDNYDVVYWKDGGSYTQHLEFPFKSGMENGRLELRIEARGCDKCRPSLLDFAGLGVIPVTNGVTNTGVLNQFDDPRSTAILADDMANTRSLSKSAVLHFEVNKADVNKKELSSDDIKLFVDYVEAQVKSDDVIMGNIAADGFASPEGPRDLNQELSVKRAKSGNVAMDKLLEGIETTFDITPNGADWEGFRTLVAQSNIKDKDLILQVLDMYSSSEQRNEELKNMTAVFEELKTDILPKLRRTQMIANSEKKIKDDATLKAMALEQNKNLDVEELLYAANNLIAEPNDKVKVYEYVADKFNDVRGYNNLGATLLKLGKYNDAKKALNKASQMASAPEITTNLYALALAEGDTQKAQQLLSSLQGDAKGYYEGYNKFQTGDYSAAAGVMSGYPKAVAEVMNGNYDAAVNALQGDTSARADYLRAIIGSRKGDVNGAVANLKSAIAADPAMKAKAAADAEFNRLRELPEFANILK